MIIERIRGGRGWRVSTLEGVVLKRFTGPGSLRAAYKFAYKKSDVVERREAPDTPAWGTTPGLTILEIKEARAELAEYGVKVIIPA